MAIGPEESVRAAAMLMKSLRIGCLPVVEGEDLVGIITEADFLALVISALADSDS